MTTADLTVASCLVVDVLVQMLELSYENLFLISRYQPYLEFWVIKFAFHKFKFKDELDWV